MDSKIFLNRIKKNIKGFDEKARLILFGSRSRGDEKYNSDWDFLILMDQEVSESLKSEIRNSLFDVELESEQVIGSIIHSKASWNDVSITPFYKNVQKEGVIL